MNTEAAILTERPDLLGEGDPALAGIDSIGSVGIEVAQGQELNCHGGARGAFRLENPQIVLYDKLLAVPWGQYF